MIRSSGIRVTPAPCGFFPEIHGEEPGNPEELYTDYDNFQNYSGVDNDDTAEKEVQAHPG